MEIFPGPSARVRSGVGFHRFRVSSCSCWRVEGYRRLGHERMGLGESEKDAGEGEEVVTCSICFETVMSGGARSMALLQCGHQFHLDCIGSAFNAKGVMQCPNCRKVEKGDWLYASGPHCLPDVSADEWRHDEDLYNLSHSETTFGVHWHPFSRLARIPSSFAARASSTSAQSLVPPYLRAQGSVHQHNQYHNLQSVHGSLMTGMPQVRGLRSLGPPPPLSLPDQGGYFLFPPSASSGHSAIAGENIGRHHFFAWECERFAPYPVMPAQMESSAWRPFLHLTGEGQSEGSFHLSIHLA
ncbi:unnamed protein product [Musa acuminata var. zebrina]